MKRGSLAEHASSGCAIGAEHGAVQELEERRTEFPHVMDDDIAPGQQDPDGRVGDAHTQDLEPMLPGCLQGPPGAGQGIGFAIGDDQDQLAALG